MPKLELWVQKNFPIVFCFGTYNIGCTLEENREAKIIFKKCQEIKRLTGDEQILFFFAFGSLISNLRIHLEGLKNNKPKKKGQQLVEIVIGDKLDPIAELALTDPNIQYDWNKDPFIEEKITIFAGSESKKKPKVTEGLDPVLTEAAKELHKRLNKANGKKKGIPDFVNSVAYQVDSCLKKLIPEMTTGAIIRDLFLTLHLDDINPIYVDISQIDNFIKRGREAALK